MSDQHELRLHTSPPSCSCGDWGYDPRREGAPARQFANHQAYIRRRQRASRRHVAALRAIPPGSTDQRGRT
jgi:hypothetical protein